MHALLAAPPRPPLREGTLEFLTEEKGGGPSGKKERRL
jgi:hypothetical protein